jgi:hypothetical protein
MNYFRILFSLLFLITGLNIEGKAAWSYLQLIGTIGSVEASTTICFGKNMTTGLDVTYDAGLLRGATGVEIYTRLVADNGVDFGIQCLPIEFDSLIIPVGIESKKTGNLIISAILTDIPSTWAITLEDKVKGTFTNINNNLSETISVTTGFVGTNRFYIHIKNAIPENRSIVDQSAISTNVQCFNAYNAITIAGGSSSVSFPINSSITLIAGQTINFLPGFHAEQGSYMYASITTNNTFCNGVIGNQIVNQQSEKGRVVESLPDQPIFKGEKSIKVYPNPNNGQFTLELSNIDSNASVCIYNLLGTRVYQSAITENNSQKVDLLGIKKGIYIVKITDRKEQFTKKVIVNK